MVIIWAYFQGFSRKVNNSSLCRFKRLINRVMSGWNDGFWMRSARRPCNAVFFWRYFRFGRVSHRFPRRIASRSKRTSFFRHSFHSGTVVFSSTFLKSVKRWYKHRCLANALFCCRHPKNQRWGCRKILFQGIVEPPSNPWIYLWYRRMLFLLRMPITMQVFRKSSNRFHPPLLPWHPWSIVQRGRILLPKESRGGSTYGTTHQGTPCGHRRSVEGDKYFSCSPQWSSGGRLSKWLIVFQWSSQGEHRLPEARRFSRTLGSISSRSRV